MAVRPQNMSNEEWEKHRAKSVAESKAREAVEEAGIHGLAARVAALEAKAGVKAPAEKPARKR